jgi:uncharacterized protein
MTLGFGPDFRAALRGDLYGARTGQSLLASTGLLVALIAVIFILQNIAAIVMLPLATEQSLFDILGNQEQLSSVAVKAAVLGILPASLIAMFVIWKTGQFFNASSDRGIPLAPPDLGVLGWAVVVGGFIALMLALFSLTFFVLGIDPATYAPTKDGLNDPKSLSGIVEKAVADLADEPMLFAIALPGIAVATPIAEELTFRGAIFSALRHSWFGKTGAVLLTAAGWAVIHGLGAPWLFVFVIFLMGIVLGILLLRTGSLAVTIACHACWNLFTTLNIFGSVT